MHSTWHALLQDVELMPQYQDFGFQSPSRLEAIAQHADEKEADCNHAANRRYPRMLDALTIVRTDTVVRWHRMGVSAYWRWRSRSLGGRPRIGKGVRDLIRRMSLEN